MIKILQAVHEATSITTHMSSYYNHIIVTALCIVLNSPSHTTLYQSSQLEAGQEKKDLYLILRRWQNFVLQIQD